MANYKEYVIESGDNLTWIAKHFDTTVEALVELNNIKNPDLIYAGDTLKIPVAESEKVQEVKAAATSAVKAAAGSAKAEAEEETKTETKEETEDKNLFAKIADKLKK